MADDDIVTRLRDYSARGAVFATNDMCWEAADEIERLRRWQSQATTVIENWDAVFDALIDAKPTDLGVSKSVLVAKEIIRLRAQVARLGAFLHPIGEQARRG